MIPHLLTFAKQVFSVPDMTTESPPTTTELLHAYMRSQLWRIGMTFHKALGIGTVRWAMEKSALAMRHKETHPQQLHLTF